MNVPSWALAAAVSAALGVAGWAASAALELRDRATRSEVVLAQLREGQPSMLSVGRELGAITTQLQVLTARVEELGKRTK